MAKTLSHETGMELLRALRAARAQLVTLGGDDRNDWGDEIQGMVLDLVDAARARAEKELS